MANALVGRYEETIGAKVDRDDLRMFEGVQAVAMLRYFMRLYDRTRGATNLFPHVPKMARAAEAVLAEA